MTVVQLPPSGEVTPHCRIEGCTAPILGPTRGRYANLCGVHSAVAKGVATVTPLPVKPSEPEPPSSLVELAASVERFRKARDDAQNTLDAAEEALDFATTALREALEDAS